MEALFEPLAVGDITLANRIGPLGMSAMTRNRADTKSMPNYLMKKYYLQRVLGGAGIIVTEGTLISPQGSPFDRCPGIWNIDQVGGWKKITNVVHLAKGKIYCQLWHVGRLGYSDRNRPVLAPSAIPVAGGRGCFQFVVGSLDFDTPTEIPDPSVIVQEFKDAAVNAKMAGFDGVELHAAAGFLVHQFLDSGCNVRTDKWGGSSQNRAQFGLEVLRGLVEIFGSNVALKVSPAGGFNDVGMPLEETIETFSYFISEADKLNLSYISLDRYAREKDPIINGRSRGTPHDLIATYGQLIQNAKTFVVGGVTPAEAEELVRTRQVDGVFFGIPWLAHPDLAKRIRHDKRIDNIVAIPHLYGDSEVDPRIGYTDYPAVTY